MNNWNKRACRQDTVLSTVCPQKLNISVKALNTHNIRYLSAFSEIFAEYAALWPDLVILEQVSEPV